MSHIKTHLLVGAFQLLAQCKDLVAQFNEVLSAG
jgi:hypothetical protein